MRPRRRSPPVWPATLCWNGPFCWFCRWRNREAWASGPRLVSCQSTESVRGGVTESRRTARHRRASDARRADRRRPRARPVRRRAAWRHPADHARHPRRVGSGRHARRRSPWPAASCRARSTSTTRCPAATRSRSPAPASSGRCGRRPTSSARSARWSSIRLSDVGHDERRVTGTLVAADDARPPSPSTSPDGTDERVIAFDQIDRAKTVFEWGAGRPSRAAEARRRASGRRRANHRHGPRRERRASW